MSRLFEKGDWGFSAKRRRKKRRRTKTKRKRKP
jgi:hypothetical protein